MRKLLEVIVCSAADAVEAELGGADRLEVVRGLEVGGLTPPMLIVEEILQSVSIPVRVMLREKADFGVASDAERNKLQNDARAFGRLAIDGVVLGFVKGPRLDLDLTQEILACIPHLPVTFHRAFEEAADQAEAIRQIKKLPQIDRILTSGGANAGWEDRMQALKELDCQARPELTILAGGNLCQSLLGELSTTTALTEFHVGRAAREPAAYHGQVRQERVMELRKILDQENTDEKG